jgi:proprotein convertase subtilisin/kexin type 5
VEIQLCANPSAPYPCTACQAYTNLNNGLCSCKDGYYMNTNDQPTEFCDLCHGSCRTCYGPLSTNCISCPSAFTFDNSTARCVQANSLTDQVISMSYYI